MRQAEYDMEIRGLQNLSFLGRDPTPSSLGLTLGTMPIARITFIC